MASNQLVANPAKTNFLLLNHKGKHQKITIGKEQVEQCKNATLLGMKLNPDLNWKCQIKGVNSLSSALNSKLFLLQRIKGQISKAHLTKIAESLYLSKLRYGL
jgi:hypothetical protein